MCVEITCDQMAGGWNYDDCILCRHFSVTISPGEGKGRKWSCSLNNKPTSKKREFQLIWAFEYMRAHGTDIAEPEIKINYIGKRKRKANS